MGEVTTASLLSQAKKKKGAVSRMADASTPVVMPPDKPKTELRKIYEIVEAIKTLAATQVKAAELQGMMEDYQWYSIDESLNPALAFLTLPSGTLEVT